MDLSAGISLIAVLVALATVWWQFRSQQNKEIAGCAVNALQSAFSALTQNQPDIIPPPASRGSWLEAARQIEYYKSYKRRITSREYLSLCEQHEAAARYKFRSTLGIPGVLQPSYYQNAQQQRLDSSNSCCEQPLEPRSILVIYDFAMGSLGHDPILRVDVHKILGNDDILAQNPGLKMFLETSEEFKILRRQV